MKSVLIIGSGLGGLSCGVILAKNGYDVTVLEQNAVIGGCLQCFSRRGVKFETGMHFIGSADQGQTLSRIFRYLELTDKITLSRLDTDAYNVYSIRGKRYRIPNGREAFIKRMTEYFPDSHDDILNYVNLVDKIASASSLHSLRYAESDITIGMEYSMVSMDKVIEDTIKNPLLREVLVGHLPLYAGERGRTPFALHAFITDFYNQSAFRIVGGSDKICNALSQTIARYGGRVLSGKKAVKIMCDNEKATGVTTADGSLYSADIVISDIHPARVMEMIDSPLIRPAFRKRMMALPNTTSGFAIYLHFKDQTVPYMNSNFYGYRDNGPWDSEIYNSNNWPKGYLYMHMCTQDKAKWAQCGVLLSYMNYDEVKQWEHLPVGHRGSDYEAFKQSHAQQLLDVAERDFPGIKASIAHYYTSTPLTYRDYTGTEGGSMYGVLKDVRLGAACRVPQRTRIPNLLLTGQNINSHGVLGVLVGTVVTCSELIPAETIYQQIIKAQK